MGRFYHTESDVGNQCTTMTEVCMRVALVKTVVRGDVGQVANHGSLPWLEATSIFPFFVQLVNQSVLIIRSPSSPRRSTSRISSDSMVSIALAEIEKSVKGRQTART